MAKALVVDVSAEYRDLAVKLLGEQTDLELATASSGQEAIDMIRAERPDLVITHVDMVDMNGLDFVSFCREAHPGLPVMIMTGRGNEDLAAQALNRGAASYVPKRRLRRDLVPAVLEVLAVAGPFRRKQDLLTRLERTEERFVLPSHLESIRAAVMRAQEYLMPMGLCNESGRMQVGVALEEALLNAYYHGNLAIGPDLREKSDEAFHALAEERLAQSPYKDRRIFFTMELTPERGRFVVRDEGAGFDTSNLPDPDDSARLMKSSGRGLVLIRSFMDEVAFDAAGHEITMIKYGPRDAKS